MASLNISLERRRVDGLKPHDGNTKVHTSSQIEQIGHSIQRFGFNDPIGITADGVIVEGEGRWRAAQQLGMEEVPVLVLTGLTEREAGLYRIAHNKIALTTGFKLEALITALRDLVDGDITFAHMGFDDAAITKLGLNMNAVPTSVAEDIEAANLDYIVMWDSPEQKREFENFLTASRQNGETASDALVRLLTTTLQSGLVSDGAGHENVHHV